MSNKSVEQLSVNTIRILSAEAVEGKSGHPGMPMGATDCLYSMGKTYEHNPSNPSGQKGSICTIWRPCLYVDLFYSTIRIWTYQRRHKNLDNLTVRHLAILNMVIP